jgi:HAD superfamily hydrolase (TIGR01549 family)
MIKAIIFDIGGPINDETEQERLFDDAALAGARTVRDVSAEEYVDICERVVHSFAPRAYRAIIWELAKREQEPFEQICKHVRAAGFERFNLRPEVPDLLKSLAGKYKLGIAANSDEQMVMNLRKAGIFDCFKSTVTAGMVGMHKPNLHYFELVLGELGVGEDEAVMVGDRQDCDMVPALTIGMKAVRLRTGRHVKQQPRMPSEVPDAEIAAISELPDVLAQWA